MKTQVYLTNFNTATLRCENGTCCLFTHSTCDTTTVQIHVEQKAFDEGGLVLNVEVQECKDGGRPYLVIADVIKAPNLNPSATVQERRYYIQQQLKNYIGVSATSNEYRITTPNYLDIQEVDLIFNVILPNHYTLVSGCAFADETSHVNVNQTTSTSETQQMVLVKTRFPDVYEVTLDGSTRVTGNHIAFIPSKTVSLTLAQFFTKHTSGKFKCSFNTQRQKWTPVI